jgi:hypothetical protein
MQNCISFIKKEILYSLIPEAHLLGGKMIAI